MNRTVVVQRPNKVYHMQVEMHEHHCIVTENGKNRARVLSNDAGRAGEEYAIARDCYPEGNNLVVFENTAGLDDIHIGRYGKTKMDIHKEMDSFGGTIPYVNHLSKKAREQMGTSQLFEAWHTIAIIEYVSSPTHPSL